MQRPKVIATDQLMEQDLPPEDASDEDVWLFALTFDPKTETTHLGERDDLYLYEIDLGDWAPSELRARLYFEQRRRNHRGSSSLEQDGFARRVVQELRTRLLTGRLPGLGV